MEDGYKIQSEDVSEAEIVKLLEKLTEYYLQFNTTINGYSINTKYGKWTFSQYRPNKNILNIIH